MAVIFTSKGQEILVDDEDLPLVAGFTWCLNGGYAYSGKGTYMHRLIMGAKGRWQFVDHINGIRSDNRRCNLRFCTHAQNLLNRSHNKGNKLRMKGVCPSDGKFRAFIQHQGRQVYLGFFDSAELAKEFRDLADVMLHGEFAKS